MNNLKTAVHNGDEKRSGELVLSKEKLPGLNQREYLKRKGFVKEEIAEFLSFLLFCLSVFVFGTCSVAVVVVAFGLIGANAFSLAVSQEEGSCFFGYGDHAVHFELDARAK